MVFHISIWGDLVLWLGTKPLRCDGIVRAHITANSEPWTNHLLSQGMLHWW